MITITTIFMALHPFYPGIVHDILLHCTERFHSEPNSWGP